MREREARVREGEGNWVSWKEISPRCKVSYTPHRSQPFAVWVKGANRSAIGRDWLIWKFTETLDEAIEYAESEVMRIRRVKPTEKMMRRVQDGNRPL